MTKTMTVAAVLLALLAGPALAQRQDRGGGRNPEGLYLGAGVGDFSSAVDEINSLDDVDDVGIDFSDGENARKLFGGWRFNRFFALQADWVDFGDSSGAVSPSVSGTSDVQGLAPSVVGTLPIGPIELFGRVGRMFYEIDLNLTGGRIIDERGEDTVWAGGLGIDVLDRLNLRLEYEEIDIAELDEADALWLTAAWKF
ncbi:MAG TPA: outer membrane beta-barrel protein [Gammaproteobacteria bacterium]|nr:outer membrane beta-barrel protein [Gammaproteobacteria bacterium]